MSDSRNERNTPNSAKASIFDPHEFRHWSHFLWAWERYFWTLFRLSLVFFFIIFILANHHYDNVVGTLLQACAWSHANPIVVEHITLLSTMSDYRQQNLELKIRDRLSVADTIALVHHLGVTRLLLLSLQWTLSAFLMMMPLRQLMLEVRYRVSLPRRHMRGNQCAPSDSSISAFLLSPFVVKKGDRPSLVCKPKSERS